MSYVDEKSVSFSAIVFEVFNFSTILYFLQPLRTYFYFLFAR